MPVKIRLTRRGRKKQPFYHIVVADSRAPRDGKYIEKLGMYDPTTKPATIDLHFDKALDWLQKGAQPTDTCRAILSYKGVLLKKHLQEGVKKNALTQEEADRKFNEWLTSKEEKIRAERETELNKLEKAEKERLEAEKKISDERAQELAKRNAEEAEKEQVEAQKQEETQEAEQEQPKAEEQQEETQEAAGQSEASAEKEEAREQEEKKETEDKSGENTGDQQEESNESKKEE
jgi:small subunit ribosomal protein S16